MMSYSQNNEQQVILEFFGGRTARFLDVGAFDGITLSNTRALAEAGWSGVMVEPSPCNACKLIDSVKQFDGRIDVWPCAVSTKVSTTELRMSSVPDKLWATTISKEMPSEYIPDQVGVRVIVPTVRISSLLDCGPFQFISIDAEWMDFDILKDIPDGIAGCELLCIEPRGIDERREMVQYLQTRHGFEVHFETNENIIARREA